MKQVGDIYTFKEVNYELLENSIVPRKKNTKFMGMLVISSLLLIFVGVGIHLAIFSSGRGSFEISVSSLIVFAIYIVGYFLFIIVHELLHGVSFRIFGKVSKEDIVFGVILKSGLAYCVSKIPVTVYASRLSLMMPVYVICLPLYILSIILGDVWMGIYAILLFSGSVGDIYYLWKLRKKDKDYYMYETMPTKSRYEIGYLLFKKL
jgi:hypothetical protein